jgi:hypothetical protein
MCSIHNTAALSSSQVILTGSNRSSSIYSETGDLLSAGRYDDETATDGGEDDETRPLISSIDDSPQVRRRRPQDTVVDIEVT